MSQNSVAGLQINLTANISPYAAGMEKAAAINRSTMRQIKAETDAAVRESKGSLMLLGETLGVHLPRHLQTFVSKLPGVANAMSAAFNSVAIVALLGVVVEAGKKVAELAKKFDEAKEKTGNMYQSFSKVLEPIQASNDELTVTNDRLQASIDKLQGKPHNGIKDAIDEAIVVADTLLKKLTAAYDEIGKTLSEQTSSTFSAMLTMGATNSDIPKEWYAHKEQNLEAAQENQRNLRALNPNDKAGLAAENKRYLDKLKGVHDSYLALLTREYNASTDEHRKAMLGFAKDSENAIYQTPQGELKHSALENQEKGLQERATVESAALTAEKALIKALNERTAQQRKIIEGYNKPDVTGHVRTLPEQLKFFSSISPEAGNRDFLSEKRNEVWNKMVAEGMDASGSIATPTTFANYDKTKQTNPADIAKAAEEMSKLAEAQAKFNGEQQVKTIDWREKTGQLTQHAAAIQLAALHAAEYAKQMGILKAQYDQIALDLTTGKITKPQADVEFAKNKDAQGNLTAGNSLQTAQDAYNLQVQTAGAGFTKFFNDFEREADDTAKAVQSALTTAMNGFNDALTEAMMGHNKSKNWSKAFEQTGSNMIHSGLKMGESQIMKALGLGKPDGSIGKPFHVIAQGLGGLGSDTSSAVSGVSGGFMSFLKKLGGLFGGFFAAGGDPDPYRTSIVGENGPELFTPKGVSGTITPNNKLRSALGSGSGGYNPTFNIDATGTNAAEVNMRVKKGMQMAYQQAVSDSMKTNQEHSRRIPGGRK